jgi:hypothetical protein
MCEDEQLLIMTIHLHDDEIIFLDEVYDINEKYEG